MRKPGLGLPRSERPVQLCSVVGKDGSGVEEGTEFRLPREKVSSIEVAVFQKLISRNPTTVTRVPPVRRVGGVLHQQILIAEVINTAVGSQWVGSRRIFSQHRGIPRLQMMALIDRPTEVLSRTIADVEFFPGHVAHIPDVQRSGISVFGIVAPRFWFQGHSEGVAKSERPNPTAWCPWLRSIKKRVGRQSVPIDGIQPQNLAAVRVDRLGPEGTYIFVRLQNAFIQGDIHVSARLLPAVVGAVVTGAITHGKKQGAIGTEHQRAHSMGFVDNRNSGLWCFPKEHQTTLRVNAVESVGGSNGVPGHSTNGRTVVLVDARVVLPGAGVQQMVAIDGVEQIDPAVLAEARVQSHTEETMVPPSPHLIRDVQDGLRAASAIGLNRPNFARAFPRVRAACRIKSHPHQLVPASGHPLLVEPWRKESRRPFSTIMGLGRTAQETQDKRRGGGQ